MRGHGTFLSQCIFGTALACTPIVAGAATDSSSTAVGAHVAIPWRVGFYSIVRDGEKMRVTAQTLAVIDQKTGDIASIPDGPTMKPLDRPMPKWRPRVAQWTAGQPVQPYILRTSPFDDEVRKFLQDLFDGIRVSWEVSKRKRSAIWDPEADFQLAFSVDLANGFVSLETQSSPAESWALEEFRAAIGSLAPVKASPMLLPRLSPKLFLKFYFLHTAFAGPDAELRASNFLQEIGSKLNTAKDSASISPTNNPTLKTLWSPLKWENSTGSER